MSFVETISANATPAIRWFKQLFTREALIDGLKTSAWVVPLTILIWLYAEQQKHVDSQQNQTLQVQFHTSTQDRIVTPVNQSDDMIMVKLNGPKVAVDDAIEAFNKPGENPMVRIDVPPTLEDQQTYLTISDRVRDAEIFKKYGVTVGEVSPSMINVNIDTLKTLDVEVKPQDKTFLEGTPTFTPHTVKVTAPLRIIQKAKDAGQAIVANAQIPTEGEAGRPGIHENILVPVVASITGQNVTISPSNVTASYTVKQNDIPADINSLSIFRVFGGGLEDQYSVEGARTNIPVKISGPKDQVDRVMANQNTPNPPYAFFRVDSSESSQPSVTKQLSYFFGEANPNVRVLEPNPANSVTYSVKKRQAGP